VGTPTVYADIVDRIGLAGSARYSGFGIKALCFGGFAITIRDLKIEQPTTAQYAAVFSVTVPVVVLLLLIFHSGKFREEVTRNRSKPNQALEPTAMSVTPPAAQEPRQP
jgi:hypothetical protein